MQGRTIDRTIQNKTYTQEEITLWQAELKSIYEEIKNHSAQKSQHQTSLSAVDSQLRDVKAQIQPIEQKIQGIQAQIEIIQSTQSIDKLSEDMKPYQMTLGRLMPQLNQIKAQIFPIDENISRLRNLIEIKETQLNLEACRAKIISQQNTLGNLNNQFYKINDELSSKSARINTVQSELQSLEFQKSMDDMSHSAHHFHHGRHHHHSPHHQHQVPSVLKVIGGGLHLIGDVAVRLRISDLRSQLDTLLSEQSSMQIERDRISNNIHYHQNVVNTTLLEIRQAENRLLYYSIQDKVNAGMVDISQLRLDLTQCFNEKSPLAITEKRLMDEISANELQASKINKQIKNLENRIFFLKSQAKEYTDNLNIDDLQVKLKQQRSDKEPFETKRNQLQKNIDIESSTISSITQAIQQFEKRKNSLESNYYLMMNRENPQQLLINLSQTILREFKNYDENYPANQSNVIRSCLIELQNKMNFINNMNDDQPGQYSSAHIDSELAQKKYLRLCGLLWNFLDRVDDQEDNMLFAQAIMSILGTTYRDPNECMREFFQFKQTHQHEMHNLTKDELDQIESDAFDEASRKLQLRLDFIPRGVSKELDKVKSTGLAVKNAMNVEKNQDIKFCTKVLNKTSQLLETPLQKNIQDDYIKLAHLENNGQPSAAKKVGGFLLAFLGAVLIIGSTVTKIVSLGLSSLLTSAGIMLGSAMIVSGIGLFCNGMRKGTSKQMINLSKSALKANIPMQPEGSKESSLASDEGSSFCKANEPGTTDGMGLEINKMPEPSAPPPPYSPRFA